MSKPQDGFVSRFLNRPISRRVSRILLQFPISPNAVTIGLLVLPLISSIFLVRGGYLNIVIGAVIFQIHSVLDGCDGEIARAKGLESKFGQLLDDLCDLLAGLLFIVALGFGLNRPMEGIICVVVVVANELLLLIGQRNANTISSSSEVDESLYPRHRIMIAHSGLARFAGAVRWIIQLTKRDVAILAFLILAILDLADWILHLWTTVAVASLLFSGVALARASRARV